VVAACDPGALGRILGRLQNLNLTPRRVLAETTGDGRLYFEVDIVGVSERDLAPIAAKAVYSTRIGIPYVERPHLC
jgi:hypothetical protein